jgi:hypothetical protein
MIYAATGTAAGRAFNISSAAPFGVALTIPACGVSTGSCPFSVTQLRIRNSSSWPIVLKNPVAGAGRTRAVGLRAAYVIGTPAQVAGIA